MIIQEKIEIQLNSKNIKYYESLGYDIPKTLDKNNILRVKNKTKIFVKTVDLPKGSTIKVLCKCDYCGKIELVINQSLTRANGKHFCHFCSMQQNETKQKISKQNTGKKRTDEYKKSLSQKMKGKRLGKLNPNWNPSLSNEERLYSKNRSIFPRYSQWRKKVLERDNHICQKCGSKEQLCAHHIDNFSKFNKQRIDIDNGITLCFECHQAKNGKSIHNIFGTFTNKKDLEKFLSI